MTKSKGRSRPGGTSPAAEPALELDVVDEIVSQWRHQRPDLDPSAMRIFGRTARIFALQRRAQALVHEPLGLSHAAFDVLANLRRSGPPHRKKASSLARSSLISTGGVTFRLDGLEKLGLIRRVRDEVDRRVVYAELTDAGLEVIDTAIAAHLAEFERLLHALTPDERDDLANLLAKLEQSVVSKLGTPRHDDADG